MEVELDAQRRLRPQPVPDCCVSATARAAASARTPRMSARAAAVKTWFRTSSGSSGRLCAIPGSFSLFRGDRTGRPWGCNYRGERGGAEIQREPCSRAMA
eukprot:3407883-Prymnesium_polylepis.1